MSEANTATTETTGTEAPADTTAETGASTAPAGGEQQQSSETGQGEGQGAGNETGDTVAAPNESEQPKGDEGGDALGAPEQYADFTVPEDVELKGEMLDGLTAFAKAHNLNQAQAQALVDLGVKQAQTIADTFHAQVSETPIALPAVWAQKWSAQTTADPEIGGANLKPTMDLSRRVFATFASPGLVQFLNDTGLTHHPEIIRFVNAVGKVMSEDTLVTTQGGQNKPNSGKSAAEVLYPDMK